MFRISEVLNFHPCKRNLAKMSVVTKPHNLTGQLDSTSLLMPAKERFLTLCLLSILHAFLFSAVFFFFFFFFFFF